MFEKASAHLPTLVGELEDAELLYLYARFKQATVGPCNTSKPGLFDFQGKKKWNAWNDLGNMSALQAQEEYVHKIRTHDPAWDPNKSHGVMTGPAVSRPVNDCEDVQTPGENELFEICKQGDVDKLMKSNEALDITDNNKRTLLHWGCDRGHFSVVRFLLEKKCDVNAQDVDFSTPLHYASSCGYANIVTILLKYGADMNAVDVDGDSPIDCAETEQIRELLRYDVS